MRACNLSRIHTRKSGVDVRCVAGALNRLGEIEDCGTKLERQGTSPNPYSLHPKPYTLHPTPYTLHPTPYTLHPKLYTLHPKPQTPDPTPYTANLTPYTPNPKNWALNSEPHNHNVRQKFARSRAQVQVAPNPSTPTRGELLRENLADFKRKELRNRGNRCTRM